ncbi:serine hydrolase [Piscinibacter sp. HJYY11]|uniref:serine hydrolase domain-containing protein n=1 Tax=Piscinibacter sp. HJYY11 TaxID=2801333 RepID=UPI00191F329D|nr:serine hydrolase [Piscinibacter sp. HJYY11]MBL0728852.1 serine hydrolase [Piscinibacter sp. HJYY11]
MRRRRALTALPLLLTPGLARAEVAEPAPFAGFERRIDEQLADVRSVVVLQRGRTVFEYHRSGFGAESLHSVESVTKGVLSLLVGIALAQGRLADLDRTVVELLPELAGVNADPRARTLTVRHLLTMTAGFEGRNRRFFDPKGLAAFAMSRRFTANPGEVFRYDNPGANLLAAVLAKAVGAEPAAYAQQHLFTPLAIERTEWEADFEGHSLGFRGLRLRTRDMAKLGQLMLQRGAWHGRPLVPDAYLAAATEPRGRGGPPLNLPYGYLWWLAPAATGRSATFFASGFGGQLIWVHEPLELVVAVTSEVSEASNARGQAVDLARGDVVRAAAMPPRADAASAASR